jgi:ABC-type Na+ transport system ATPase subunit NatA
MLEGLTDIDDGEAYIDGIDVRKHPYDVKKIIGVQLQTCKSKCKSGVSLSSSWI